MLLNYHSYYGELEPTPQPVPAWLPEPVKKKPRRRRRVDLSINAELPGLETYAEGRARVHVSADAALLMLTMAASGDVDPWGEMLLIAAALLYLDEDDEDDEDDE